MANLLAYKDTFFWEDASTDRGINIQELNSAIIDARNWGDSLYKTPDLFEIELEWGDFFEFIYSVGYDEKARKERYPWMTSIQHQTLIGLLSFFKITTPLNAIHLDALKEEYPREVNSMVGLYCDRLDNTYVYDQSSWERLHSAYVESFDRAKRIEEREYFQNFFAPGLRATPNQINQMIEKKQVNHIFLRLDVPKQGTDGTVLHNEKVQMHFADKKKSALNIDGTWKHGGLVIPDEACEQLIQWGFLLPENL
jgi:hypothetical protein